MMASGAASALYGPSHGGANEAALKMLEGNLSTNHDVRIVVTYRNHVEIGTVENIPAFIEVPSFALKSKDCECFAQLTIPPRR